MFCSVLNNLQSPENVGTLVRSHVAFGGAELLFVGQDLPWRFKKGSQAFSRKLERQAKIVHIPNEMALFEWCIEKSYVPVAIEISTSAYPLSEVELPVRSALIVGNEKSGLSQGFLGKCAKTVVIPQAGPVGSLNVAVAGSIAMYTHCTRWATAQEISSGKFVGEVKQ